VALDKKMPDRWWEFLVESYRLAEEVDRPMSLLTTASHEDSCPWEYFKRRWDYAGIASRPLV